MNNIKSEDQTAYNCDNKDDDKVIKSALKILKNRIKKMPYSVTSPQDTRDYLQLHFNGLEHEVFTVLFLNQRHKIIKAVDMFRGTIDGASVYPREVVKETLKHNAAAVIFAHNHPSGNSEPSQANKHITKRLKEALSFIDVRVLDHFVIGETVVSFAERGLI